MEKVTYTAPARIDGQTVATEVTGRLVAPGLAIGPALNEGRPRRGAYLLVHIASGKHLGSAMCRNCARFAAVRAMTSGVDWTADAATIVADKRVRKLHGEFFWLCEARPGGPNCKVDV